MTDYDMLSETQATKGRRRMLPEVGPYTAEDYWGLPDDRRAELINGRLYDLASPSPQHQRLVFEIAVALRDHVKRNGGPCEVFPAPFAVNLDANDAMWMEPDVSVVCDPAKISDRACEGAPDLVVEVVSPSSQRMDYLVKADRYERAGVREYWIVDPRHASTLVYRYETGDPMPTSYPFATPVPVSIWQDCTITVGNLT